MAQIDFHFNEVITSNTATARAIDDGYVERAAELVRLAEAKELLAPYTARHLKELRCPICGHFVCNC